jgi:hypothetical protein
VPVKITPDLIDDSMVSLTFLTIQPNHDAWIKSFFQERKRTAYKGLWAEDGGMMQAIPLEAEPRKWRPYVRSRSFRRSASFDCCGKVS